MSKKQPKRKRESNEFVDVLVDQKTGEFKYAFTAKGQDEITQWAVEDARQAERAALGQKSGKARRAKAAKTWQPHALELATHVRKTNPRLSQEGAVSEIVAGWKYSEDDIRCPSFRILKAFVSSCEKDGRLPKRVRPCTHKTRLVSSVQQTSLWRA